MLEQLQNRAILDRLEQARAKSKIKQSDWPDRHIVGPDDKPVPFHKAQEIAHDTPRRIVAMIAGAQSGKCLADYLQMADGTQRHVSKIVAGDTVLCLDENLKIKETTVLAQFSTGAQTTYRITTKTGRSIVITYEHPLLSPDGWKQAGEFMPADFIAVPRQLNGLGTKTFDKKLLRLLGYLIGDGGLTQKSITFSCADNEVLSDFESCIPSPCSLRYYGRYSYGIVGDGWGRKCNNPVMRLLRETGLWGKYSYNKRIPEFVFSLADEYIGEILSGLIATDGCVHSLGVAYTSTSEGLIDDIQHLLLRLGIVSTKSFHPLHHSDKIGKRNQWGLTFGNAESLLALSHFVFIAGDKGRKLIELTERAKNSPRNNHDRIPNFPIWECWDSLEKKSGREYVDKIGHEILRMARNSENISRDMAGKLSGHFGIGTEMAQSDIYWDRVKTIEPLGNQPVWDIEVADGHNFISKDIFAHNTSYGPWWLKQEIDKMGRGDYLAATSSFRLFQNKMLPELLRVFENILGWGRYWAGNQLVELKDPETGIFWAERATDVMWGRIILGSAQTPSGLESSTAKAAWLDEAGQDEFSIEAYRAINRRLSIHRGRKLITSTLYNYGYIKSEIIDPTIKSGMTSTVELDNGAEIEVTDSESTNAILIQFDSITNPNFPKAEYEEAKANLPEDLFNMAYRGRISRPRHMIYDCLNEDLHFMPRFAIPNDWQRYVGLDFGAVNTVATFWAEHPESRKLYCYREYKHGGRSAKEHVEALLESEPMLPLVWGGAKAEGQWRQEFRDGGLSVKLPKIADVWLGINIVYSQIKQNNLFFFDDLPGIENDMLTYRRKYDNTGNPTDEIYNKNAYHYADTVRNLVPSIRSSRIALLEFA